LKKYHREEERPERRIKNRDLKKYYREGERPERRK
jgi:hypothetical protein